MTRYGRKGGDGPNTGKTSVAYSIVVPETGAKLKRRFFNNYPVQDGKPLEVAVAALLPPVNGHDWIFWVVAASREAMPSFVNHDRVVFVEARLQPAQ